jgi:predicted amidohydrolase
MQRHLAAVVQLTSTSDVHRNLTMAEDLVRRAARYGASIVATPENTTFLGPHADKIRLAETLDGAACTLFSGLAKELGIHLLLGSFAERSTVAGRCHNTSVLFGPDGGKLAVYRKIHLFDVDVSDELRFRESETVAPGSSVVVAETALGRIGLSICYDLRFGELYRALRKEGAIWLTVPSAFTLTTGKDHWETLVRARAIENQCVVLAPAQHGRHDDGGLRQSWGHSAIVDAWGQIVACASDGPGIALAEIEPSQIVHIRSSMPVDQHRRLP